MSNPSIISQSPHKSNSPIMAVPSYNNEQLSDVSVLHPLVDSMMMKTHTDKEQMPPLDPMGIKSQVEGKKPKKIKIRSRRYRASTRRSVPFPLKLMQILEEDEFSEIIRWMPNGKTFLISCPKAFVSEVLTHKFKSVQYSSFTRKLTRWGFSRSPDGTAEFYHPMFQRGRVDLAETMIPVYCSISNTDDVKEEDGETKEEKKSSTPVPGSSDQKERGDTNPAQFQPSTVVSVSSSPLPWTCDGPVPGGFGTSLSNQVYCWQLLIVPLTCYRSRWRGTN